MKKMLSLVILPVFLAACQGAAQPLPTIPQPQATASPTDLPTPAMIVIPTRAPDPTATSPTRLPPEAWQEWPVVPTVTPRAIQIYQSGLAMGLDPHAFSKVGDCQSVKAAFLGYFDDPARYSLGTNYAYLQATIDNFKGHFNTDGQAVRGGANAAWELSPLWADPQACLPGENPLECELRITRPIIVIVRMEIWWNGRTTAQYEKLMRQILDTIIAHGAVPILATKADNVEGDNSLNLATARLAYEYDLPLWNFWAAVQPMAAHGMETTPPHNDGFHISMDAWSVQSFTGLEALDSVWRGLLSAAPFAAAATPTPSLITVPGMLATLAQTPGPVTTPLAGTPPAGGAGRIVFGLARRQEAGYQTLGVYVLDLAANTTRQIFGADVQYQSASPDGKYLLVSLGPELYRTDADGANPILITRSFFPFGDRGAIWMKDGRIAAVLTDGQSNGISLFDPDGASVASLSALGASPIELYPGPNSSQLYWAGGACTAAGVCKTDSIWVTSPDGSLDKALAGLTGPALSPDGQTLVGADASAAGQSNLVFAAPDGANPSTYSLPGDQLLDYAWAPSGGQVAAIVADVISYSGRFTGNHNYLVDPHTLSISEYPTSMLLHPRLLWSPDGVTLAWIGTLPVENGFTIGGSLVNKSTKRVTDLGAALGQSGPDYLVVTTADWLPVP